MQRMNFFGYCLHHFTKGMHSLIAFDYFYFFFNIFGRELSYFLDLAYRYNFVKLFRGCSFGYSG
jgi:hypothetical protein